jgi:hypothetical protein
VPDHRPLLLLPFFSLPCATQGQGLPCLTASLLLSFYQ